LDASAVDLIVVRKVVVVFDYEIQILVVPFFKEVHELGDIKKSETLLDPEKFNSIEHVLSFSPEVQKLYWDHRDKVDGKIGLKVIDCDFLHRPDNFAVDFNL
jgi:hypothetical protein